MALTRAFLKGMNLTEEQVGAIVEAHTDTVNALKSERDAFKAEAEKVPELQKQIASLQEQGTDDWQGKYEQEHKDFEQYKKDVVAKEEAAKVEVAYRKLLADNHVGETHIDSIIGVTDLKSMAIGEDGKIVDEAKVVEDIKTKWAGFMISTRTEGAGVDNPPAGNGAMTKEIFDAMPLSKRMEYANEHPSEVANFK